jgi:DNA-binding transcriptional ArsR family regulator
MRNTFYTKIKVSKREAPGSADCVSARPVVGATQEWSARGLEIHNAIQRLPEQQREVMMLIGVLGMSYEEAATICNCAIGTIKSRLNRARLRLLAELGEKSGLSAVERAEAYIDARNAYDSDRARELVADDFRTTEFPDGYVNVDTMELAFEMHQVWGFHYAEADCVPQPDTTDQIVVRCDYLWTTEVHRARSHEPTPTHLTVTVVDGRIAEISRGVAGWAPWFNRDGPWEDVVGAYQSRLSFHLKRLKDAGVVTDRKVGRWVYYALQPEALAAMRGFVQGMEDEVASWPFGAEGCCG